MMADFVRDHIGYGEIAGRIQTLLDSPLAMEKGDAALARPTLDQAIDEEDHQGPDHRADETGGLTELINFEPLTATRSDERPGDPQQYGHYYAHVFLAGIDELGDDPGGGQAEINW